jgi:Mrp family chromosome partitioning ATPase
MGLPPVRGDLPPLDSLRPQPGPAASAQQAIGPYLRAVRRNWIIVVAITLLTAAIAAYTVTRSGPSYQATASILVTPLPQGDPTFIGLGVVIDTGDPARTIETAAALVDSTGAAAATAAAMGPGWTVGRVQSAVSVTPLGQSDVLAVTASSSAAGEAARLATTYARSAIAYRAAIVQRNANAELASLQAELAVVGRGTSAQAQDLSSRVDVLRTVKSNGGDPTLSLSQAAQPPSSPSSTPRWLIVLLALMGGFALGSIAALGVEFFGRPARDEEEITSIFPVPVLASIPKLRSRGNEPMSPWLFPPEAFEQVRMLRVQLELTVQSPVIMVTSAGAGDGKTTVVGALAAAFAESGQDVIVMDLDLRKPSLERMLEIDTAGHREAEDPDQPLSTLVPVPELPNVKLLPVPAFGSTLDQIMARLPLLLAQARRAAACVIVDTAPVGEVSEGLRIAPMCETVVFVARPRHTDRRRLATARDLLARAGARVAGLVLVGQPLPKSYGGYHSYPHADANGLFRGAPPSATADRVAGVRRQGGTE